MATMMLEAPPFVPEEPRKLWTRTEYRRLIAEGILQDGKVELVNGEIWEKMGQGRRHILVCMRVLEALVAVFGFKRLQSQSSLPVSEYGDPEPDIALLKKDLEQYLEEDPTPEEMVLVVEVSDSTLRSDLTAKARQYGSAGIPEYWVLDIPNHLLHVFRDPISTGYATETILTPEDEVSPLAAPDSIIRVTDLMP